jgi:hypothetical protein
MPAKGEHSGSCGGAPGNEPSCPGPGAELYETGPTTGYFAAHSCTSVHVATTFVSNTPRGRPFLVGGLAHPVSLGEDLGR